MTDTDNGPVVGFFPGFFDIGETYPLIRIAKKYQELGGKVIIFSHGGDYEYIAKEQGFKIIKFEPIASGPDITRYFLNHSDEEIIEMIKNQEFVYQSNEIKAMVQTCSYVDCILASMIGKIPLISIISGTLSTPYLRANYATYPDNSESLFTQLIPQHLKNRITNFYTLNYKGPITKKFNRIAKKTNISVRFRSFQDIRVGNYTLISDDIEFLGLNPTDDFSSENFVGPILSDDLFNQKEKKDEEIENHLKKPGKSILLTMGSSKIMKGFFLQILETLNETDYKVIATYTSLLKEDELPHVNDNILLKKFIPFIAELNKKVDLAVIHGGRGTVYNAAYSGKPAIGFPLNGEQQFNLDCLVRHKGAKRLSKTFFSKEKFLNAIQEIFNNYNDYLKNAQILSQRLQKSSGDKKAAKKILEIVLKSN